MEEKCEYCDKVIGEGYWGDTCDGVQELGPDPYAQEINDDDTEYWMCSGARYESAMDI